MRLVSTPAPIQVTGGARRLRRGLSAFFLLPVIYTLWMLKMIFRGIVVLIKFGVEVYHKERERRA